LYLTGKIRLIIPSSIEKNYTETDMIEPASHMLGM